MILSDVDKIVEMFSTVKKYFYLIERRGWTGIIPGFHADIKLVEDEEFFEATKKKFPNAIVLRIAGADFVNTDKFKPLKLEKKYDGIQISAWQNFKRPELFFGGAKILPKKKFIKFGHLFFGGKDKEELKLKNKWVSLSKKSLPNVFLPYGSLKDNYGLPQTPEEVNKIINSAKIGILTSKVEGINRFKLECLSANIPVMVPEDANYALKKHINKQTGILYSPSPEGFSKAMKIIEDKYYSFSPRRYILKNTGNHLAIKKLKKALKSLAKRDKRKNIYKKISWDGRNESLLWEDKAVKYLQEELNKIQNFKRKFK